MVEHASATFSGYFTLCALLCDKKQSMYEAGYKLVSKFIDRPIDFINRLIDFIDRLSEQFELGIYLSLIEGGELWKT